MLKKRIIPCLDIKDGRTVKGINFEGLKDAGDPVGLAIKYAADGADELVFLDITATQEDRGTWVKLVAEIARNIHIPFTVGGGITSLDTAAAVLDAGADKVSINSAAVRNPALVTQLAQRYGSQAVVLAIDAKQQSGSWQVYVSGGKTATGLDAINWAKAAVEMGAGEILLTSMDNDGVKNGFDIPLLLAMENVISIPIIASGGAGSMEHFKLLFERTKATGGLAASVFHYNEIQIPALKVYLSAQNLPIRL